MVLTRSRSAGPAPDEADLAPLGTDGAPQQTNLAQHATGPASEAPDLAPDVDTQREAPGDLTTDSEGDEAVSVSVDETEAVATGQTETTGVKKTARRRWLVSALIGVGLVALVIWQRGRIADVPRVLAGANWLWIGAAIAVQALSMASLALLQRRLLSVDGRHHSLRPILAAAYAGNAISVALPIVGTAASSLYVYRRFVGIGVDKVVAAWALLVAGVYSTLAFFGLSALGAVITGSVTGAVAGLVTIFAGVVPTIVVLAVLRYPRVQVAIGRLLGAVMRYFLRLAHHPTDGFQERVDAMIEQIAGLRLNWFGNLMAARFAILNWTADVACLAFVLVAVGAPVPWSGLLIAWAAGAGASSLGLTPGGLGVVEAALTVALIAVGLPATLAVSAVLVYRFISLWLVLAVGTVTLMVIKGRAGKLPDSSLV